MKKFFICILFVLPLVSNAQGVHLNLFGGILNYQGDLQGKPFTFEQSNGAAGVSLSYDLTTHFSLRSGIMYGKVMADDKQNKASLQFRNLNFKSTIAEGNLLLEYKVLDLEEKNFTPYAFAGLAVYHFNPYTFDSSGTKFYLKPLSTEGQGLANYPDRKPYRLTQFSVPFGGGIKIRMSEGLILGYEIGMRKIFTDYLDDVSTTYVDGTTLAAAKGPNAVQLAYRGDELKNGDPNYPIHGTLRGSPKAKDWYYFQGITLSLRVGYLYRSRGQRLACPPRVL